MRGVVSLAAALSIPLYIPGTQTPFPERSLVLYITFVVITLTLILQGLTLPVLLKLVKLPNYDDHLPHEETERIIRIGMAQTSLDFLRQNHKCEDVTRSAMLANLVTHWNEQLEAEGSVTLYDDELRNTYHNILIEQRLWLNKLNNENPRDCTPLHPSYRFGRRAVVEGMMPARAFSLSAMPWLAGWLIRSSCTFSQSVLSHAR